MTPTHDRVVVAGDRTVRVQGDFGGGYIEPLPPNNTEARRRAIIRALIYMPGADLIDACDDASGELQVIARRLKPIEDARG